MRKPFGASLVFALLATAFLPEPMTGQQPVTLKERATLKGHTFDVSTLAFSPDGKLLASTSPGAMDRMIKLWDPATGEEKASFQIEARNSASCVAFSPDSKTLAAGCGDGTVRLWDVRAGKQTSTLKGHTKSVRRVAFSPDGKTLASASSDGTVKLWDAGTAKELATLKGHTGRNMAFVHDVCFSPDSKTVA